MKISGNVGLPNFTIFSIFILGPTSSKWPIISFEHEYRTLEWDRAIILYLLDSPFFQNSASHTSFPEYTTAKKSILEMIMEALHESEQQSQNFMDSRFHHNFQNQLSCSPSQEELIGKSIKDMILTQNSVTRPISRLDLIMSELINKKSFLSTFNQFFYP